jgi:tetratricopeptide (TPR) repeat protein
MSPEQARGLPMDQRTDVGAFGCVLYEMLTGHSAFGGRTISDTIARILEREPDWRALPSTTPPIVRALVRRCLQKDLQRRLHDIALARSQIHDATIHVVSRRKVIGLLRIAAGAILALTIFVTAWWHPWKMIQREFASTQQHQRASTQHEPVSILIADFQNSTNDPAFDHTLELTLWRALEGARFINAYYRNRFRSTFGVRPPDKLDEEAARQLASNQGLGVVVSGSVNRQGSGYEIAMRAIQTVDGKVVASGKNRASNKEQVLGAATKLATLLRKALGDETSDSAQMFAMRSVSTTSLDVYRHYAAAIEAQSDSKLEQALLSYHKTVELDPNFGLGYQGLANVSRNLGRLEESNKYSNEALKHIETMTDRERFAVRVTYYVMTGDFQQCAKEYGEMITQFAGDATSHNNRAVCLSKLRNMREATDEMRRAVQILPKRILLRANLALFTDYAGDFQTAEREVKALQETSDSATLALAFAQLGQGRPQEAIDTYKKLGTMGSRGASWAAFGLGDVALYEGRFSDAARLFEQGAAADLASRSPRRAARKFLALADARLWRRQKDQAIAAAENALVKHQTGAIRFLAARVFVQAGAVARARIEAARISLGTFVDSGSTGAAGGPAAEPEAYAKIIEAEIALANEDPRQALRFLTEANTLADIWLGHFDLGLAYLKVPSFARADSEFEQCLKRRGEAISLFFDEEPTYGFLPPVFYYQGIAREGLNRADSAESFRAYMDIRASSTEDRLVRELRRRPRQ